MSNPVPRLATRSTWADDLILAKDTVKSALAHTLRDKTEAAYKRTDLFHRRRDLMERWARFATAKPADVVTIGRA
jgi:hypothetical protein